MDMIMKNPPHPGRQIRYALEARNLNVTEGAKHFGVTRNTLSRVINGSAGISPDMAVRISKTFGGSADIWVRMQAGYDLAQVLKNADKIIVKPIKRSSGTLKAA